MAGILDKKTRVIDYILTKEGKNQLARGDIRFTYASFTDSGALYKGDKNDVIDEEYKIVNFEPVSTKHDTIVPEFEITGHINYPYDTDQVSTRNGIIEFDSEFLTSIDNLKNYSNNAISKHGIILSEDISSFSDMKLLVDSNNDEINIDLSNINKYKTLSMYKAAIEKNQIFDTTLENEVETINAHELKEIFNDAKFYNQVNYKFMPPLNSDGSNLKNYRNKDESNKNEIISGLDVFYNFLGKSISDNRNNIFQESYNFLNNEDFIKSYDIEFLESSSENNIGIQIFEIGKLDNQKLFSKLVAVDHGDEIISTKNGKLKSVRIISFGKIIMKTEKELSGKESLEDFNEKSESIRYIFDNKMSYLNIFTVTLE